MILTLCIDKQPKTNPSNELKTYKINIGNRLCSYDDVYDELIIKLNDVNQLEGIIKRRCNIDRFDIITKLQEEYIQTLEIPEITLFEGTNYVYLQEFDYLNMRIEYLTNVEMNKHFAKTEEFNSALVLTAQEFNLRLSQKLDGDEFTHASIVAKINDDTSEVQIEADKINMKGKEFNLTADEMSIESENFSVDKDGNATMKNANITGGSIELRGDTTNPKFKIYNLQNDSKYSEYFPNTIRMWNNQRVTLSISNAGNVAGIIARSAQDTNIELNMNAWFINITDGTQSTLIEPSGITTPTVTQTSKEEYKKNFEKLDNALDIIKNIDIYKYNLKSDKDTDKKHIGFVIGDKFNYSEEVTSKNNDGVDTYSFASVCCKAIQEQQKIIEQLQERINRLESDK